MENPSTTVKNNKLKVIKPNSFGKYVGISGPVDDSALAALLLDSFPVVLALLPSEFDSVRSFFQ